MTSLKKIETNAAPQAIGPYSQAVQTGNLLFVSGQIPLVPASGEIIEGGVAEQTKQSLTNIQAILNEAGLSMNDVVKVEVFMTDLSQFQTMNEVYGTFFTGDVKPARQAFEVCRLPKDVQVEISCIAQAK